MIQIKTLVTEEEKPYNALKTLETDEEKFNTVESLLKALIDFASPPPINCTEWTTIEELEGRLNGVLDI